MYLDTIQLVLNILLFFQCQKKKNFKIELNISLFSFIISFFSMKEMKKNSIILIIKESQYRKSQITAQTQSMRDDTNQTIRLLGEKYYQVKNVFDRYGFNRDILFSVGKELEMEYKNVKKDIILKNKSRRMKESIICWYAQHFFNELFQSNSVILHRLNNAQTNYNLNIIEVKYKNKQRYQEEIIMNGDNFILNSDVGQQQNKNTLDNFYKNIKTNIEIDNFDMTNASTFNECSGKNVASKNGNFNFDLLKILGS